MIELVPAAAQRRTYMAQCRMATPLGPMTAAATDLGLAGLWFDGQRHHPGPLAAPVQVGQRWLQRAAQALPRWFEGDPAALRGLALDPQGSPFQRAVWQALLAIPRGESCSYGALSAALGRPAAARAVGAAVGRNPVSLLIPCHRVVGSDGSLTGYAGGLDRKRQLLSIEVKPPLPARRAA